MDDIDEIEAAFDRHRAEMFKALPDADQQRISALAATLEPGTLADVLLTVELLLAGDASFIGVGDGDEEQLARSPSVAS
jgi:hypothetical protein